MENFRPEVGPGDRTLLAHRQPFASYIARMHRKIHPGWGFESLADLERRKPRGPLGDPSLWMEAEIRLDPDGKVAKLVVTRPSGHPPFDRAAMGVVRRAAPFGKPPASLVIRWRFYRDQRQCSTEGVTLIAYDKGKSASSGGARSR